MLLYADLTPYNFDLKLNSLEFATYKDHVLCEYSHFYFILFFVIMFCLLVFCFEATLGSAQGFFYLCSGINPGDPGRSFAKLEIEPDMYLASHLPTVFLSDP